VRARSAGHPVWPAAWEGRRPEKSSRRCTGSSESSGVFHLKLVSPDLIRLQPECGVLRDRLPPRAALFVVAGAYLLGCGHSTGRHAEAAPVVFEDRLIIQDSDDRSPLGIPLAALPPAGACRLWKAGRPVREQARAGACAEIEPTAPPGSWILYRPSQDPRLVHVRVVDPDQAGRVTQVRVYDAERGTYLGSKQRTL
jgi:hypothetical protein